MIINYYFDYILIYDTNNSSSENQRSYTNRFIKNITITMYSISMATIRQYLFNINIHYASYIYEFMMLSHYPATQVLVFFNKLHNKTTRSSDFGNF